MAYTKTGRGGKGLTAAGKKGYAATQTVWKKLIFGALRKRGVKMETSKQAEDVYEHIIDKVFTNNFYSNGEIGFTTIDSYVGLLQATNQLPGVKKYGGPLTHFNHLKFSTQKGDVKKFQGFGKTSSSSSGLKEVRSRLGWR